MKTIQISPKQYLSGNTPKRLHFHTKPVGDRQEAASLPLPPKTFGSGLEQEAYAMASHWNPSNSLTFRSLPDGGPITLSRPQYVKIAVYFFEQRERGRMVTTRELVNENNTDVSPKCFMNILPKC